MNNQTNSLHSWLIVAHSAIGLAHVKRKLLCQDFNHVALLDKETGIAVVCDGAGSAAESHLGAKLVAKRVTSLLKREILSQPWQFPSDEQAWRNIICKVLSNVHDFLVRFSSRTHREVKSLACTVIVIIYNPQTILISHIGDGRAAYRNKEGQWRAIMTPFKGEEANQTIFITSQLWRNHEEYLECNIIHDDITAFALMSDGCERHSFQINNYDEEKRIYVSLNEPYNNFFQPLVEQLLELYRQGHSPQEINSEWQRFIESGTEGLAKESDDKTLILGILKA
jgi:hypothetical protein